MLKVLAPKPGSHSLRHIAYTLYQCHTKVLPNHKTYINKYSQSTPSTLKLAIVGSKFTQLSWDWPFLFMRSLSNNQLLMNRLVGKFCFSQRMQPTGCSAAQYSSRVPLSEYNDIARRTLVSTLNMWMEESVQFLLNEKTEPYMASLSLLGCTLYRSVHINCCV